MLLTRCQVRSPSDQNPVILYMIFFFLFKKKNCGAIHTEAICPNYIEDLQHVVLSTWKTFKAGRNTQSPILQLSIDFVLACNVCSHII